MSEAGMALVTLAKAKRAEAAGARRLAATVSPIDVVNSLNAYADRLETDAFALDQQVAEMQRTVERSKELAEDVQKLAFEVSNHLNGLKATLHKKK